MNKIKFFKVEYSPISFITEATISKLHKKQCTPIAKSNENIKEEHRLEICLWVLLFVS